LEDILGLPVARPAAEGSAKLDMSVLGPWQGFAPAVAVGTAQLHNVRAEIHGMNVPIEIGSATVSLSPDVTSIQKFSARIGNTHWSGGVTAPRHCAALNCVFQFDLSADQLSTGDLAEWFTPHPSKRPWYRILNSNSNSSELRDGSPLLAMQARGNLHVGRFGLKKVFATQVATQVELDHGKITLTDLRAQLLQGTHQGIWTLDVSPHDPSSHDASTRSVQFHGAGALRDISLAQVGALMNDGWITGTADGTFVLQGSGNNFRELMTRSDGKLQFVMRNGSLPHIEIPGSPAPLPVHRFSGELNLKKGAWNLSRGRLESRGGLYQVSGTVSPDNGFDFGLTGSDDQSWTLTGTLAEPHVAQGDRTEAKRVEGDQKTVKP
jgi:hypothetical protein